MVRSLVSVIAGVITAGLVMMVGEFIGYALFATPIDPGLVSPEEPLPMGEVLSTGAMVSMLLSWFAGSAVGAWMTGWMAGERPWLHAVVVGVLLQAAGVAPLVMNELPTWMVAASALCYLPAALLGAWVFVTFGGPDDPREHGDRPPEGSPGLGGD